ARAGAQAGGDPGAARAGGELGPRQARRRVLGRPETWSRVGTDSEGAARWRGPTACRGRQNPARQTFRSVNAYPETTCVSGARKPTAQGLQFCRAGFAGRGTDFARPTERHTPTSSSTRDTDSA